MKKVITMKMVRKWAIWAFEALLIAAGTAYLVASIVASVPLFTG